MKISGEAVLGAPVHQVWEAVLDPAVLVRTIPGCERLDTTGENAYAMTVSAGVAAVRGTYTGTCELRDLQLHESLVLKAAGSGAPGTIGADVQVRFTDTGEGTTQLNYEADAVAGGMIGGVGQRMLTSAGKRLAGEFFSSINDVLSGAAPGSPAEGPGATETGADTSATTPPGATGTSFTPPARVASGAPAGRELVQGVALGGGLVLAGVLAGAWAARRRG